MTDKIWFGSLFCWVLIMLFSFGAIISTVIAGISVRNLAMIDFDLFLGLITFLVVFK